MIQPVNSMAARVLLRAASTAAQTTKAVGDISSVFPSLSGKKPAPLPERFSDVKRRLVEDRQDILHSSWLRLLRSLRSEIEEVKNKGSNILPSVNYTDVQSGTVSSETLEAVRRRGLAIIRGVITRREALELKSSARQYIAANAKRVKGFPPDDPAVYELYWTPSQTQARAHPNMLRTQHFLQSLWHSSDPLSEISTTHPLTYADRFRIRSPGDAKFALGPHADGGSLERWEDAEYSKVYQPILDGRWEDYDAFDAKYRIAAKMDLYNGAGACSMFRFFQGWLSMSDTSPGEGTMKLCPMLKHATAYLILRPLFDASTSALNLDPTFPGSVPGACQEYNEETHPHLDLANTMVSVPRVEPGDFVAWHCDTIHAVDREHRGQSDSSVLYIPACPMTPPNVAFLKRQGDAALRLSAPPDFPGAGGSGELGFVGAVEWELLHKEGLKAMGLGTEPWAIHAEMSEGERKVIQDANASCFGDTLT